ncbi:f-box domain containing protein [Grosmannia clavigera kw1407]|uniref:F-box domain containing protein n=1 Tax=Grosmannia clavigera (strain kw1407 / UAMH 11150) TaxID=655863 RepID=F0XDR8_GROCL|nr:f-box domain containing protein [Grosmannia clavigera kw1407]EFX03886.1 f-box domain containing protein [Grosmannia clavigera kw1407]
MAPPSALLNSLPIELVDLIVSYLNVKDIASLRLSCRALNEKASYGRFTTFFRRKNIRLTTHDLERLVYVTSHGCRLACLLQECTVTGVLDRGRNACLPADDDVTLAKSTVIKRHTELLTEAFGNIKKATAPRLLTGGGDGRKTPGSGFELLHLRVGVRYSGGVLIGVENCGVDLRSVCDMAQRTFRIAMDALETTQLAVRSRLDLFHGQSRCSLNSRVFADVLHEKMVPATSLRPVFASLQHLAVSLDMPQHTLAIPEIERGAVTEDEVGHAGQATERQAYFCTEALHAALDLVTANAFPQLDTLNVHWLYVLAPEKSVLEETPLLPLQSSTPRLLTTGRRLSSCSLSGTFTTADFLLQFLQTLQPSHVALNYSRMPTGTYDTVFSYLADPASPVTSYDLDDLVVVGDQNRVYVRFLGPITPNLSRRGFSESTTLSRGPGEAKTNICFEPSSGWPVGSTYYGHWRRQKESVFGPRY